MSKNLVLVTGGSGSTGGACVLQALKSGYRVRTTVRRESAIKEVKSAPTLRDFMDDLEVVVVPDMTKVDAFLEVLQGVTYVLHVASPMPHKTDSLDEEHTITPAVHGTICLLESALKYSSIKRVVITSSINVLRGDIENEIYNENTIQPIPQGPFTDATSAYSASKRLAYKATRTFIATSKPRFTIVNIMPAYIIGRHEIATTPAALATGSNGFALSNILGRSLPIPISGITVHVADVARVHIEAMTNVQITTHENFLLNANGTNGIVWADAIEITEKHFPMAVEKGILPLGGYTQTLRCKVDGSKAERVFGIHMKGFEEQIVSVVGQYVELAEKQQGHKA